MKLGPRKAKERPVAATRAASRPSTPRSDRVRAGFGAGGAVGRVDAGADALRLEHPSLRYCTPIVGQIDAVERRQVPKAADGESDAEKWRAAVGQPHRHAAEEHSCAQVGRYVPAVEDAVGGELEAHEH